MNASAPPEMAGWSFVVDTALMARPVPNPSDGAHHVASESERMPSLYSSSESCAAAISLERIRCCSQEIPKARSLIVRRNHEGLAGSGDVAHDDDCGEC